MIRIFRKKQVHKPLSGLTLSVFVFSMIGPSGPALATQPELEQFTPVGYNNLVDPFTGDFSYNIPLMTVPGPDGGYPINLAYSAASAGPGMEAGWVGLGWNINPGAINRGLRGLPDDFDGSQEVVQESKMEPNKTHVILLDVKAAEAFGLEQKEATKTGINLQVGLTLNNYNGPRFELGFGLATINARSSQGGETSPEPDPQNQPSYWKGYKTVLKERAPWISDTWSSITSPVATMRDQLVGLKSYVNTRQALSLAGRTVSGMSFASQARTLELTPNQRTTSRRFNLKIGGEAFGVTGDITADYTYLKNEIAYPTRRLNAYGYLHTLSGEGDDDGMMDYYRDKAAPITADSRTLPVPVLTYDIFSVTGQGVAGSYRAQLGQIPILHEPAVEVNSPSMSLGGEANFGTGTQVGVNGGGGSSKAYSGPWQEGGFEEFREGHTSPSEINSGYEKYTFIDMSDNVPNTWDDFLVNNDNPYRLNLSTEYDWLALRPHLEKTATSRTGNSTSLPAGYNARSDRQVRTKQFTPFSKDRILELASEKLFAAPDFYDGKAAGSTSEYDYSSYISSGSTFGAIRVTATNGYEYRYDLPAITHETKKVTFSSHVDYEEVVSESFNGLDLFTKATEAGTSNDNGPRKSFSEEVIPAYAHSFLLTSLVSPDYVDVEGDGPTSDDLGQYTKFDYERATDDLTEYSPKRPNSINASQGIASLSLGVLSSSADDISSYTEETKDVYYLRTIETRTHKAVFNFTYDRTDGVNGNNAYLAKLNSIVLYDIDDASNTPIQTVHFEYVNNGSGGIARDELHPNGKLALRGIYYTYGGNNPTKASNATYEFTYHNETGTIVSTDIDRWGTYQSTSDNNFLDSKAPTSFGVSNYFYPYTNQSSPNDESAAGYGKLNAIDLPSGGRIEVDYEMDTYAFVQNKAAMQMYPIIGLDSYDDFEFETDPGTPGSHYIYVGFPEKVYSEQEMQDLLARFRLEAKEAYVKMYMPLKDLEGNPTIEGADALTYSDDRPIDIVETYVQISSFEKIESENATVGYSGVKLILDEEEHDTYHPLRIAGHHHLRNSRAELFSDPTISFTGASTTSSAANIVSDIIGFFKDNKDLMADFVPSIALGTNYDFPCKEIVQPSASYPLVSCVRLPLFGSEKRGGGHRVKEVRYYDYWGEMAGENSTHYYKENYTYETLTGESSGVAEWEPAFGGEENSNRGSIRYSSDRLFVKDDLLAVEKPITEAFFPAPSVGYSRVVVTRTPGFPSWLAAQASSETTNLSLTGITEYQYFTAKEFPIRVQQAPMQKVNMSGLAKTLVFLGQKKFVHPGLSTGYSTVLNNMHGKQKSVATYHISADFSDPSDLPTPVSRTTNFYQVDESGDLDSERDVMRLDALHEDMDVGVVVDMWMEMREVESRSISAAMQADLTLGAFYIIPTGFPDIDFQWNSTRTAVMNKVVNRKGHLLTTVSEQNGAVVTTNNLSVDYASGSPIVSQYNDAYGNSRYSYTRPAYWVYPDMGPAYSQINQKFTWDHRREFLVGEEVINLRDYNGSGELVSSDYAIAETFKDANGLTDFRLIEWNSTLAEPGDEVEDPSEYEQLVIVRPGKTNRISASVSSFLAMTDVSTDRTLNFETYIDTYLSSNRIPVDGSAATLSLAENTNLCGFGAIQEIKLLNGRKLQIGVKAFVDFPETIEADIEAFDKHGEVVRVRDANGRWYEGVWHDPQNLFKTCMDDLLSVSVNDYMPASRYHGDNLGNTVLYDLRTDYVDNAWTTSNPDGYARTNGYSVPNARYVYHTSRTQTDLDATYPEIFRTRIDKDGVMTSVEDFNFSAKANDDYGKADPSINAVEMASPGDEGDWIAVNQASEMNEHYITSETRNAIGVYSAQIFAEDGLLSSMQATNSFASEIGFASFEFGNSANEFAESQITIIKSGGGAVMLDTDKGHTGNQSLRLSNTETHKFDLSRLNNSGVNEFLVRFWATEPDLDIQSIDAMVDDPEVTVIGPIDGWYLYVTQCIGEELEDGNITIDSPLGMGDTHIDDLQILPADSRVGATVYDPLTHRVIAVFDDNHFATMYSYDEEGKLTQVRRETSRGVQTIQSSYTVPTQVKPTP